MLFEPGTVSLSLLNNRGRGRGALTNTHRLLHAESSPPPHGRTPASVPAPKIAALKINRLFTPRQPYYFMGGRG